MEILGILIVLGLLYFLYKKGLINNVRFPVVKNGFSYKHYSNRELWMQYKKYNGVSSYPFTVKAAQTNTFHYEVEVSEGSLELNLKNAGKSDFHKEFHSNEKGSFTVEAANDICMLVVTGKYTKGSCSVTLEKESSKEINT